MTSALDVVNRAAEIIGYKDPDETLSGNDAANFLSVLNDMVDAWNTQSMFSVNVQEIVQSVSGLPITIGPGGTINTTRPTRMEDGAFIRLSGVDCGITWISQVEYDGIAVKSVPGQLSYYGYYDTEVPLGKIYLWPYPSAAVELHLQVQTPFAAFADLATDYTLAPGYKKALTYSLAEELAPGRRPITADVARIAAVARRIVRRTNVEVPSQGFLPAGPSPYAAFIAGL